MTRVKGKNALLIGGTRGVGMGTALALYRAGAHVTIVGRSDHSGAKGYYYRPLHQHQHPALLILYKETLAQSVQQ